jgi:hypothetical protein
LIRELTFDSPEPLADLLGLPQAASSEARTMILAHIEQFDEVQPTKFDGNVWEFVKWVEKSKTGRSLKLNLNFRPL